ncbi:hypothetical protein BVRB_4g090380 [Beta vulgaris subsp. vulgaris]|nr:hypothetical protein BVRB_4g090380 [Beta vulgaris subsp. vulgaris]
MKNDLPGDLPVKIHCKSKDDDLGERKIEPHQTFRWRFTPNIFESTLYWCNAWSKFGYVSSIVFSEKELFYQYCKYKDCTWSLTEQGLNVIDLKTNKPVLWRKWNENAYAPDAYAPNANPPNN